MNYTHNFGKYAIAVIDIGFVYCIYFILALVLARFTDYMIGPFNAVRFDTFSMWYIICQVLLYCWYIGIVIFVVRKLVSLIPFPLIGVYGYNRNILQEDINEAIIFVTIFILFQTNFQDKLNYILDKQFIFLPLKQTHTPSPK